MWALPNLTKSFFNFLSFWAVPLILMFAECNHQYEFFNLADKPIIMILSRPLAQCSDWDILSRLNFLLTAILFIRSYLQSGVITIWLLRRDLTPWRVSRRSAEKIIIKNYVLIETKNIHRKMFTPSCISKLRSLYYPAISGPVEPGVVRCGEHSGKITSHIYRDRICNRDLIVFHGERILTR